MRGVRTATRIALMSLAAAGPAWHAAPAAAREVPLWEAGLGVGALAFRDYRGADTTHAYPLPIPYFLYNGKFLKADRDGVRGELFNQDRLELNLSFSATTPVRNNRARSGMPDLRSTVEIGPAANVHLLRSQDGGVKLDFRMPLRAALTVEGTPHYVGWTLTPELALDVRDVFGTPGLNFGVLLGPLIGDHRYHEYFYRVAPQFATPTRPAYEAAAGYAGAQTLAAVSKRFANYWIGAFARYDSLSGAAFEASPLVKSSRYWTAGVGIAWMIRTSAQAVQVDD